MYEDFVDFFGGSSQKNGLVLGSFLCIIVSFLRYRIGIFLGLLKFQIFFGVLDIPDNFWE